MNEAILKALSVPGMVSDSDIGNVLTKTPKLAHLVSDLCIGVGGVATPSLRVGGVDVVNENNLGCIALSSPDGAPVMLVRHYMDGDIPMFYAEALHVNLLERGKNRNAVESARIPYIVKRVRSSIDKMNANSNSRTKSMLNSLVGQITDSVRSNVKHTASIQVEAAPLYDILNALREGLPIDMTNVDVLREQAHVVLNSRRAAIRRFKDEYVARKWWMITNHGDYGFSVNVVTPRPSIDVTAVINGSVSSHTMSQYVDIEHKGWFKSLEQMAVDAPDLHSELYVQMVLTKQTHEATRAVSQYTRGNTYFKHSLFDKDTTLTLNAPTHMRMLPHGDFYDAASAMSSWTYSACHAKTASYCLMERVV
jgi:hypothetical protein